MSNICAGRVRVAVAVAVDYRVYSRMEQCFLLEGSYLQPTLLNNNEEIVQYAIAFAKYCIGLRGCRCHNRRNGMPAGLLVDAKTPQCATGQDTRQRDSRASGTALKGKVRR